jgi:hypothetical protein
MFSEHMASSVAEALNTTGDSGGVWGDGLQEASAVLEARSSILRKRRLCC